MRVSDDGVTVPDGVADRLDLEMGGRRVWSFVPSRDGRPAQGGGWFVPWPPQILTHLNGRADVLVRSMETREVLFEETLTFGTGEGEVELVDGEGRPLTVAKNDRLSAVMFGDVSDVERRMVADKVAETLGFLTDRGHESFLAYGNLLGAVRDGKLIGHDNDADIAYLAKSSHPLDVQLESMAIEREFADAGWDTFRATGAAFKVYSDLSDGRRVGIDVFTAYFSGGALHMVPYVVAQLPREAILPTSTVRLEGREIAAPAWPEALLAATYGEEWRVPDPSFKYEPPRGLRRRFRGLFGGDRRHVNYWDGFYSTTAAKVPTEPSSFATWVVDREPRPTSLVEIGSGTGRDAVAFAERGITVLGCDYSPVAVRYATQRAEMRGCPATFRELDLYDLRQMLAAGAVMAREHNADAVYGRFLVHALEDEGRLNLWRLARSILAPTRGRIYLEFRTEATEHEFGEHFRHYVQPDVVRAELESYGFHIEHCEDRHGLAVFKGEDPRVCRIVARLAG